MRTYIRILREADLQLIKSFHLDLFQFDYDESQFSTDMFASSRCVYLPHESACLRHTVQQKRMHAFIQ